MTSLMKQISALEAWEFLKPKHYAGRKPQITVAFGWFIDDKCVAVCTFGKPASPSLCKGILGDEYSENVYELNRLCRIDGLKKQISQFVGYCLREVSKRDWIVVSYSDLSMSHTGYVYQACNFIYTGQTKARTDMWTEMGKHSRHYQTTQQGNYRKVRSPKNRYVYFATRSKKLRKLWKEKLKYPIMPYPKGVNKNYILGEYQKDVVIKVDIKNRANERRSVMLRQELSNLSDMIEKE